MLLTDSEKAMKVQGMSSKSEVAQGPAQGPVQGLVSRTRSEFGQVQNL